MNLLSSNEIEFHPTSFCDGLGRLFWCRGDLYRGITPAHAQFVRDLFARGIVEQLHADGFIPRTELTASSLPEYPVIVRHERIPFVSYAFEWSPTMIRDAALFVIRYLRALARHHLTLGEVASWNILFGATQPRAVDFCDVIDAPNDQNELWNLLESEFRSYYLRPLELYALGHGDLARLLQADYEHNIIQEQFEEATTTPLRQAWRRGVTAIDRRLRAQRAARSCDIAKSSSYFMTKLNELEGEVAQFRFPKREDPRKILPATDEISALGFSPQTVLIIGGTDETIDFFAKRVPVVLAVDRDEQRVDSIYEKARSECANVLPLVFDLRYPAPGVGARNAVLAPALRRLRCELVVALGLIETLVFKQRLRFEQIAGTLADLSLRQLIVDFPPLDKPSIAQQRNDPYFGWFEIDQFAGALGKHFSSVCVRQSLGGETVITCEKDRP